MTYQWPVLIAVLLTGASLATEGYPQEVAAYIERRKICEHFRQEPWPEGSSAEEKERRDFIAGQFARYCKGSDQTIRELKKKYKNNQTAMDMMKKYEAANRNCFMTGSTAPHLYSTFLESTTFL